MLLLRVIALPTGLINAFAMMLAYLSYDPITFILAWGGAVLSFCGVLLYREEDRRWE